MRSNDSQGEVPAPGAHPPPDARPDGAERARPTGLDRGPSGAHAARVALAGTHHVGEHHVGEHHGRKHHGRDHRGDDHHAGEHARAAWRAAKSYADLLALGADFLAGRVRHFPGWGAPETDPETDAIRASLLALHGLGFLSLASQPAFDGNRGGRRVRQRAFVTGFAPRALADRLVRAAQIDVRAWHADGSASVRAGLPVAAATLEDDVARVLVGHAARADELALFEDDLSPAAQAALSATSYVAAFDAEFGRGDRLWTELERLGRG